MNKQRGTLLLEVLVAGMVLGTIIMSATAALGVSLDGASSAHMQSTATFLLQEELEPLGAIRDSGWANIATNGTYYVAPLGASWTLTPTTTGEVVGDFTRSVVISDAYRDGNGQIVASGGSVDPSTKKAVATVSWQSFLPHMISATTYITRYKDNLVWLQTTQTEFDLGTKNGVVTTNTSGGEVVLGGGGNADWCEPGTSFVEELDLPKSGKATSVAAVAFEAYAGTGENASGESFADILITDTNPPTASLYGTIDGYKTNDIFGESDYGYIATDNNSKEIVIISLAALPLSESGYFNAPGNNNGDSVFVANNVGYVVVKDNLYNFDLSSKSGSRPILDSNGVKLSKEGTSVYVVGNYAYVAIKGDNNVQLDIIDISNSASMVKVGSADVNNQSSEDVFVNTSGTRAYIVTNAASSDEREFHIVDITNKASPVKVGPGYYTNGMSPEGVEIVPGGRAIIVGRGGEEYQVVDISNELNPVRCGGTHIDSGIFDSASVLEPDNDAFSYIVTGDANSEFKILEGGPGGVYSASGTFESSTLDAGGATAFNRIDVTVNKPVNTDVTFQVAGADAGSDGTCTTATFSFVGPDGSSASYFTDDGVIPLSDDGSGFENPARCFRYRAYLTTSDFGATPTLYDVLINYSP